MTDRLQIMPTRSAMLPQSATLLQRKCACGTHTPAGASCPTCSGKANLLQRQPAGTKLPPPVLEPEFPLEPLVQDNTPKSNEEEYAEAGGKVVEAILETGPGKAATDWLTGKLFGSVPATAATLTGIGGGIAGLALTGKELPFQMPFVPLPPRFVGVEGLSVKFIFNGPVNNPTEGVLVFRYELPSGKKPRRTEPEKGDFVPGPRGFAANDQALSDAAISYAVAQESARFAKIRENEAAAEPAAPSGLTFPRPSLLSGGLAPGLTFDPINSLLLGEELKLELPPFILPKFDSPTLQKKLAIGASDDPLEAEADKVADHVLSRPANGGNVAPLIQRFTAPMSSEVGTVPESVHHTLASTGTPLDSGVRQDMETRFGHDFTGVRVHNDAAASQSARDVDAHAYTVGHNIVFGAGQFAPGSSAGRRLLAHELTHVVQQGPAGGTETGLVQRKGTTFGGFFANLGRGFVSIFGEEPGYHDADLLAYMAILNTTNDIEDDDDSDNKARAVVAKWNAGAAAFRLNSSQMALLIREMESGFLSSDDEKAINLLKNSRQSYIEAAKVDPLNPGTHALSATDKAAAIGALVPVPKKGKPPTFKEDVGSSDGNYGARIKARLTVLISSFHKSLFEDKEPLRADPGKNFHGWAVLEAPCKASKGVVDDLFDTNYGGGASKPELTNAGGNLIDQWTDEIAVNVGKTDDQKKAKAREKVEYLIDSNCRTINTDHSAVPSRAAEATILKPIIDGFVSDSDPSIEAKKVQTMLELDIGWEGAQLDGKVYLQQYKSTASDVNVAKEENRVQMWKLFQTCIHEYIHTLAHPDFNTWAQKFSDAGDNTRYNTLTEGFCDFFTLTARKTIDYKKVQALVEGSYANGNPPAPDKSGVYPSNVEAERVVGIVGIKNAQAAYFGGKVDLLGGP